MKHVGVFTLLLCLQEVICNIREGEWCTDKTTRAIGQCLQPHHCQSANEAFLKRGRRPTFCEYTNRRILLCCVKEQDNTPRGPSQQPIWQNNNANTSKFRALERVSERKCREYTTNISISSIRYVYGGTDAEPREFPHMGAIGWRDFHGEYNFGCGGSLISPRFVLTAGHCASKARAINPLPVIVRLGNINLDPEVRDGDTIIDAKIKAIHKHPDFRPPLRYNDIALLELAQNLAMTFDIRPACLWTRPDFGNFTNVIATGWGVTENTTLPTDILQKVTLSLYSNEQCDAIIPRNRHWEGFVQSQMCAGELGGGKDTCQGDSGAPLQVTPLGRVWVYHIMGVTSFGGRCAQKGLPAVYTRVSSYLDWIESVVWPDE